MSNRLSPATVPLIALVAAAIALGACGGNAPGDIRPGDKNLNSPEASSSTTPPSDDGVATYGYGPQPAAGVTYQPDVVFVQGGAAAIRSASGDGLIWRVDRNAPGAADLAVDKVMLLTSRATGRVVEVHDEGDVRVVTLSPITIGEVLADGTFSFDRPIDLDAMAYQEIPELPAQLVIPGSSPDESPAGSPEVSPSSQSAPPAELMAGAGAWDLRLPTLHLNGSAGTTTAGDLPPAKTPKQCLEVSVGSWSTKPCVENGKISLAIDYKTSTKAGLKVGVIITLSVNQLRLRTSGSVSGGQLNGTTAVVDGLSGVDVEITGGSVGGLSDNAKVKVELPIEIDAPIPPSPATAGLPMNVKIEFKYIVETAFTSKNSILSATGSYELNGPLGMENGSLVTPTVNVRQDLIDSLNGMGFGATGFVLVAKVKVQLGLGVPAAMAGPYVTLTAITGLTLGSSLGIVQCKLTNWELKGGLGFGLSATQDAIKDLLAKLPTTKWKIKTEQEKSWSLFRADMVKPDVVACRP